MNINKSFLLALFTSLFFPLLICPAAPSFENHFQIKLRFDFLSFQETYPEHTQTDYHEQERAPLEFFYTSLFFRYALATEDAHFHIALCASNLWEDSSSLDLDKEGKLGKKLSLFELYLLIPGTSSNLKAGRFFFDPLPLLKENFFFKGYLDGLDFRAQLSQESELSFLFDILHQNVPLENTYSYAHLAEPDATPPLQNSITYRVGFIFSYSFLRLFSFLVRYPKANTYTELSLPASSNALDSTRLSFYLGGGFLDLPGRWVSFQMGLFPSLIFRKENDNSLAKKGLALHSRFLFSPLSYVTLGAIFLYQSKDFAAFPAASPGGLISHALLGIKLHPKADFYGLESPFNFNSSPKNLSTFSLDFSFSSVIFSLHLSTYYSSGNFNPLFHELKSRLQYLWKPSLTLCLESAYLYPLASMIRTINSPGWALALRLEFFFKN